MAHFDIYADKDRLVVDLQTNFIHGLGTRLVVPLFLPAEVPRRVRKLHPLVTVGGSQYVVAIHLSAAVPERQLGTPFGSLDTFYDDIVAALDMIFLGF